ncbi:hypothetical protein [Nonomuraea sp. NPDC046570]|uniref:SCO7613 C-terminal domain-containing membrane protein n=1 Tax=Nonomuraea sp. NPDC046570 TaxID=3155255 RepID=UPI0033C0AF33
MAGAVAADLWRVDGELAGLKARESELLRHRGHLIGLLRAQQARTAAPIAPAASARAGSGGSGGQEVSPGAAQNVLLGLGGLLLAAAAVVFTVVSWGHLGVGGRAAVLAGVTGVTLAVPALLLKRGLTATAETIGLLGLGLLVLDGYAARQVGALGGLSGADYAAVVCALVALVAAGYSWVLPLRGPLPVAIVAAQLPLPLLALGDGVNWLAIALTVTVAVDAVLLFLLSRLMPGEGRALEARVYVAVLLGVVGCWAVLFGGYATLDAMTVAGALPASAALLVLAAVGLGVALWAEGVGRLLPLLPVMLAYTLGLAGPVRLLLEDGWSQLLPYVAVSLVATVLVRWLPERVRTASRACAWGVALAAGLPFMLSGLIVLVISYFRWEEAGLGKLEAADVRVTVIALVMYAVACVIAGGVWGRAGALVSVVVAVLLVPMGYHLPYALVVAVPLALAVLLSVLATRYRVAAFTAGVAAVQAVVESLPVEYALYTTLSVLFVTWAALVRRPAALAGAALSGGGLAWAVLWRAGLPVADSCAVGLGVAAVLAVAGGRVSTALSARKASSEATPSEAASPEAASPPISVRPAAPVQDGAAGAVRFAQVLAWVLAGAALVPVADALLSSLGAYRFVFAAWEGAPGLPESRPLVVVALLLAGAALAGSLRRPGVTGHLAEGRDDAGGHPAEGRDKRVVDVAVLTGALVVAVLPVTLRVPYPVVLGVMVAGVAAATGVAVRRGRVAGVVAAVWLGSLVVGWGLATQVGTLTVLPALAAVAGVAAVFGTAGRVPAVVLAGLLAGGEVVAVAAAVGVTAVEAYTLPFALELLALGVWRAKGASWPAYGPGLVLAFGPSLLAGTDPVRSLALGVAALGVTLAGARARLQAPVVLGGITLLIVAGRELAPWIAQLAGLVPRWAPIALGGLVLVLVGATYEARLRDVRRLRDAVARLR